MPRKIKAVLPKKKEVFSLIEYMKMNHIYFQDARDACILSLLYYSGFKTHELSSINKDDYDYEHNLFRTSITKRSLNQVEINALLNYLSFRKDTFLPLFISVHNYNKIQLKAVFKPNQLRLTDRSIQRAVKRILRLEDMNLATSPKDLRHLHGIEIASKGVSHETLEKKVGKVAMWVKTDYLRLSKHARNENFKKRQMNKMKRTKFYCSACHKGVSFLEAHNNKSLCSDCNYICSVLKRNPNINMQCIVCKKFFHPFLSKQKYYNRKDMTCNKQCYHIKRSKKWQTTYSSIP